MINLFAFKATVPIDMKAATDPVGPENDKWIKSTVFDYADLSVAAWGTHGSYQGRDGIVCHLTDGRLYDAPSINGRLQCLGLTKDGYPRHPLFVKGDVLLREFVV